MNASQPNFCRGSGQRVGAGGSRHPRLVSKRCAHCGRVITLTAGGRLRNHSSKVAA